MLLLNADVPTSANIAPTEILKRLGLPPAGGLPQGVAVGPFPRGGVAEARFADEFDLGEERQRAIDRRLVDAGIERLHPFGDLQRVEVPIGVGEHLPDDAARPRDPMPVLAQRRLQFHPAERTPLRVPCTDGSDDVRHHPTRS